MIDLLYMLAGSLSVAIGMWAAKKPRRVKKTDERLGKLADPSFALLSPGPSRPLLAPVAQSRDYLKFRLKELTYGINIGPKEEIERKRNPPGPLFYRICKEICARTPEEHKEAIDAHHECWKFFKAVYPKNYIPEGYSFTPPRKP